MTTSNEMVSTETDSSAVESQDQAVSESKTFTQEDLDRIVTERVKRERAKFEKQYGDVDVDRYRKLLEADENRILEEKKKRGEFDQILKDTVSKKDTVIQQLQKEIHSIKVEGALLNAASTNKAVNPDQVTQLLKSNVRLTEDGQVEILDGDKVRYSDEGTPLTVADYVKEFLEQNPHFVSATPAGTGSQSSVRNKSNDLDITQLDMSRKDHRDLYRKWKESKQK
jgi:hypothetical protein